MFKLKVADSKFLRDMVTAISILVDEATFKIGYKKPISCEPSASLYESLEKLKVRS